MLNRLGLLFSVVVLGLLVGCANQTNYGEASLNLQLGMTKGEVLDYLGKPKRTDVNESRERWFYWNPEMIGFTPVDNEMLASDKLIVTFEDGVVTDWGNNAMMKDAIDAQQQVIESYKSDSKNR